MSKIITPGQDMGMQISPEQIIMQLCQDMQSLLQERGEIQNVITSQQANIFIVMKMLQEKGIWEDELAEKFVLLKKSCVY